MATKVIKKTENQIKLKLLDKALNKHFVSVGIDPDSPLNYREELFYGLTKAQLPYYEDVMTNEKLGYMFEMGYLVSKEGTTSFLVPGCKAAIKQQQSVIRDTLKKMYKLQTDPNKEVIDALALLGQKMVEEVRRRSPLDTGQLRRAITYEVDNKSSWKWE